MKNKDKMAPESKTYEGIVFITGKGLGYVTLLEFKEDIEILKFLTVIN